MTIKQQGGIFGRNPTFNDANVDNDLTVSGSLGVGTTNPTRTAEIVSSNNVPMRVVSTATLSQVRLVASGTTTGATEPAIGAQGDALLLRTNGSTAVTITAAQNIKVNSGNGIDFSATSGTGTSELFDDYEEGEVNLSTTDANVDIEGNYVKAGRMVTVTLAINPVSGDTTWATGDTITGLPYAAATTSSAAGGSYTGGQYYGGYMMTATTMRGRFYVSGTSLTIIDGFGTSTNYSASFTYISET
jgi:hypothetical protein